MIPIKSETDLVKMRRACKVTGDTLRMIEEHIKPGVTTAQLDEIIEKFIREQGCTPSFKNLYGFPASACISVDDVVVHGIPSKKVYLEEGNIIGIDVGAYIHGFHGDGARTFIVGKTTPEKEKLVQVTKECFFMGIDGLKNGSRLGDIGGRVQSHAESHGYSVVRDLVGHGIGREMHEDPSVPNYGKIGRGIRLHSGMTIAIEPMINMGGYAVTTDQKDGWTVRTRDGSPSAHYENTVLITDEGVEILTL